VTINKSYHELHTNILILIIINITLVLKHTSGQPDFGHQTGFSSGGRVHRPRQRASHSNQCSIDYNIDYLILALQWPTSYCVNDSAVTEAQTTVGGKYTVCGHSARSTANRQRSTAVRTANTTRPSSGNPRPIDHQMDESSRGRQSRHVLAHEWTKHGSCGRRSPQLADQFQYFNTTLRLYDSFPLTDWFKSSDILATNDRLFSVNDIHAAIERQLKSRVRLECSPYPEPRGPDSAPILSEIHICLDRKTLQTIDCTNRDDKQCFAKNNKNLILFPNIQSLDNRYKTAVFVINIFKTQL